MRKSPEFPTQGETSETSPAERSWNKMQSIIDSLPGREKYEAAAQQEGFQLSRVEDAGPEANAELAKEIRAFLSNFFEEEENDTEADYVTAIKNNFGDFFLIRDKQNEIIAFMNTQVAELPTDRPSQELVVWYVVTSEEQRGKGLASELYRAAYERTLAQAKSDKAEITAIVGETDPEAEVFFNGLGRKRLYYQDDSGVMREVPYLAPPSTADEEPSPEHLMVRFIDDRATADVTEASQLVKGIFAQYRRPEYYDDPTSEERQRYLAIVDSIEKQIESSLAEAVDQKVYLYTAAEREQLQAEGKKFG